MKALRRNKLGMWWQALSGAYLSESCLQKTLDGKTSKQLGRIVLEGRWKGFSKGVGAW